MVGQGALAQTWGPQVGADEVDPKLKAAGNALGMIRSDQLVFGQLNLVEITGNGTMVDLETATLGEPVAVSRYTYAASIYIPASRLDFEGPSTQRTIRVVRGDRAWNEVTPGVNPTDSDQAVLRRAQIWLFPHGFVRAAAYAAAGKCPDGAECKSPVTIGEENGKTTISVSVYDIPYKATLNAASQPERIEATVPLAGGSKTIVATFGEYPGTEQGGSLDNFHSGTYFPSTITHEIDGKKVLDITVTEGWSNPYVVFPEPEKLAQAK